MASVIAAFQKLGLERFIRTKQEPDKEAIKREPEAVRAVKGVPIPSRRSSG